MAIDVDTPTARLETLMKEDQLEEMFNSPIWQAVLMVMSNGNR